MSGKPDNQHDLILWLVQYAMGNPIGQQDSAFATPRSPTASGHFGMWL